MSRGASAVDNGIYDRVPDTWWDEDGFMALLRTSVNPPRAAYFRRLLQPHLNSGSLRVLDVGCGGGLLAEEFARLGCDVIGLDQSVPTLAAAREHARRGKLGIDYIEGSANALPFPDAHFDVVSCCDVLEHVDDPAAVLGEISRVLRPEGMFLFDTINRTMRSKLLAIKIMQDWRLTRLMPRHVHVWEKFIRPSELQAGMAAHGLRNQEFVGLSPGGNPLPMIASFCKTKLGRMSFEELGKRVHLRESRDLSISYMGYALRDEVSAFKTGSVGLGKP